MKLIFFFSFILSLFTSIPSFSQVVIGGGCIVQDELCEQEDYRNLQDLDVNLYIVEIKKIGTSLRGFDLFIQDLSTEKKWYLEKRKFNPVLCGPMAQTESPENFEIAACQSPIEIRISENFWKNSSSLEKRNLIAHELMVSYFLSLNRPLALARSATHLLVDSSFITPHVRNQLHKLGLPFFNMDEEVSYFSQFVLQELSSICEPNSEQAVVNKAKYYMSEKLDLIAVWRPDYQAVFYSSLAQLTKAFRENPMACQKKQNVYYLAEGIFENHD